MKWFRLFTVHVVTVHGHGHGIGVCKKKKTQNRCGKTVKKLQCASIAKSWLLDLSNLIIINQPIIRPTGGHGSHVKCRPSITTLHIFQTLRTVFEMLVSSRCFSSLLASSFIKHSQMYENWTQLPRTTSHVERNWLTYSYLGRTVNVFNVYLLTKSFKNLLAHKRYLAIYQVKTPKLRFCNKESTIPWVHPTIEPKV